MSFNFTDCFCIFSDIDIQTAELISILQISTDASLVGGVYVSHNFP